ncbi:hypothetical protein CALVIDRAFT_250481 [Calocera viscosa TUFC12733]|uniref:Uncharacterized protein n=1 Tax=Calocera viscosa (strain TUFC12733) TaxID=1330018 RepID=A0A167JEU8_CALVF|nr:hypothetical protein CALVIDRAFT_250481 [Calocera viscosa TUFC12733]
MTRWTIPMLGCFNAEGPLTVAWYMLCTVLRYCGLAVRRYRQVYVDHCGSQHPTVLLASGASFSTLKLSHECNEADVVPRLLQNRICTLTALRRNSPSACVQTASGFVGNQLFPAPQSVDKQPLGKRTGVGTSVSTSRAAGRRQQSTVNAHDGRFLVHKAGPRLPPSRFRR